MPMWFPRDGVLIPADKYLHPFYFQVLEMVICWVKYNWEKRCSHLLQLLQEVRLGVVSADDLKNLLGPELLEIPGCSDLVGEVLQLQASMNSIEDVPLDKQKLFETRSTITVSIHYKVVISNSKCGI